MEENDNEDMQNCYDYNNEEMNAGVSDGNEKEVKVSDDDENSVEYQPTNMKPFNIEEDQSEIMKKYFIGKSDVFSLLFENDKDEKVAG